MPVTLETQLPSRAWGARVHQVPTDTVHHINIVSRIVRVSVLCLFVHTVRVNIGHTRLHLQRTAIGRGHSMGISEAEIRQYMYIEVIYKETS